MFGSAQPKLFKQSNMFSCSKNLNIFLHLKCSKIAAHVLLMVSLTYFHSFLYIDVMLVKLRRCMNITLDPIKLSHIADNQTVLQHERHVAKW